MIKPQILKGFRDFLPQEARKRQYVIDKLKSVFESFGFEPLETPVLEYEETLTGKYGEEGDQLMYRFEDNGKRRVAMRYDQTVPLSRVVAQYQNDLPSIFKRYQMQPVWRADNPQKGRYREFLQCDVDIVGSSSVLSDAEIIAVADKSLKALGFNKYQIIINDRKLLFEKIKSAGVDENLSLQVIREIDKLDKLPGFWKELKENLIALGLSEEVAQALDSELSITQPIEQDPYLDPIIEAAKNLGVNSIMPKKYLARGLDYYTGLIFEVKIEGYDVGSVCGGGRYDRLIGMFAGREISAVGCSFGFDRIIEAMTALNLFPTDSANSTTQVLVTIFSEELKQQSLEMANKLREENINTEVYLGEIKEKNPLEKQLKYADQKKIPYVIILGPEEINTKSITVKDMNSRSQQTTTIENFINLVKK